MSGEMFTTGTGPRRMAPQELVAAVRDVRGVELVDGVARHIGGANVHSYGDDRPIASAGLLTRAHLVRQDGGAIVWETAPVGDGDRDVVFVFPMAVGNGSPFPQPTGSFDLYLGQQRLLSFTTTKESQTWQGAGCTLCFSVCHVRAAAFGQTLTLDDALDGESAFADGLGLLRVPARLVTRERPARLSVVGSNHQRSSNWFRLGVPRDLFATHDVGAGLRDADRCGRPRFVGDHRLLVGDVHNHSAESQLLAGEGCGWGSREALFTYARDVAGLDVFCLSEHDWQMSDVDWRDLTELTEAFYDPDAFVTLPGYEWTSASYGHRNVYFRDAGAELFRAAPVGAPRNVIGDDVPSPADLWAHLDAARRPALTVPHHMSTAWFPLSLEHFHHPSYDRIAEIYSCWGDSLEHHQPAPSGAHRIAELAFIHAVRAGYRVGFVASSDSHDGHPGNSQGKPGHEQLFHHLGSGRVAVLARAADRHAVFDALAARRCYALTGPFMSVDLSVEGHPMGSEIDRSCVPENPTLVLTAASSQPLSEIAIYRNGYRVETVAGVGTHARLEWTDERAPDGPTTSYFAKVTRTDYETAWTSPIWVDGDRQRRP